MLGVRQDLPAYARSRHPRGAGHAGGRPARRCLAAAGALFAGGRRRARTCAAIRGAPRAARDLGLARPRARDRDAAEAAPLAPTTASWWCSASAGWRPRRTRCCSPTSSRDCASARPALAPGRLRRGPAGRGPRGSACEQLGAGRARRAARLRPHRWRAARALPRQPRLPARVVDRGPAAGALRGLRGRLPVVATDVGGVAEAVGEAALLVPAGDAAAAADALERVAEDAPVT